VGTGLDLGPIKGSVYGKNTGKNFLIRAASGIGSVLAEVAGNNSSAAFSESDMLRERLAENIGMRMAKHTVDEARCSVL